ncbi:probable G-protein coupled receptor 160 [Erpetoichthys calabaricus]|uniref:Probable G-protein coupled receptor 160 n=1 Tax=Erpetoichthys calabaricus TaxID=27687 RepID=A0A8C4SFJ8_ERPCA|nr:probable G-protein coupled receptor 160 [Erpetoichthys calabaricus]XP_028663622.1 probable G-protein coupled receptor 160 [Erpetoichthys calabaricus]
MCLGDHKDWKMMAILETGALMENQFEDNTSHFLSILIFKLCLNCLIVLATHCSLRKSFIGYFCLSLFFADFLLFCSAGSIWLLKNPGDTPGSLCFVLSHFSTVYSLLPVPVLILGFLDHFVNLSSSAYPVPSKRAALYCTEMMLVWAFAVFYTIQNNDSKVHEATLSNNKLALLCPIHGSQTSTFFCLALILLIVWVGVTSWQLLPTLCKAISNMDLEEDPQPTVLQSDLPFFHKSPPEQQRSLAVSSLALAQGTRKQLLLSITLGFSINWITFLLVNSISLLLDLAIPSYMSFNLLWLLCVNSFFIAIIYWYKSDHLGTTHSFPDDICRWSFYKHVSREIFPASQSSPPHGIYSVYGQEQKEGLLV